MIYSFRKKTTEKVYCRYGLDIEAESYEEALQLLMENEDWQFEKEEQGDILEEDFYYLGIRENGSLNPNEQKIELE